MMFDNVRTAIRRKARELSIGRDVMRGPRGKYLRELWDLGYMDHDHEILTLDDDVVEEYAIAVCQEMSQWKLLEISKGPCYYSSDLPRLVSTRSIPHTLARLDEGAEPYVSMLRNTDEELFEEICKFSYGIDKQYADYPIESILIRFFSKVIPREIPRGLKKFDIINASGTIAICMMATGARSPAEVVKFLVDIASNTVLGYDAIMEIHVFANNCL